MGLSIGTKKLIQNAVDEGIEFRKGNVRGIRISGLRGLLSFGRLPEEWARTLKHDIDNELVVFVILSYSTPIAWKLSKGRWEIPPVRYSVNTAGHVNVVRVAVGNYGFYNKM